MKCRLKQVFLWFILFVFCIPAFGKIAVDCKHSNTRDYELLEFVFPGKPDFSYKKKAAYYQLELKNVALTSSLKKKLTGKYKYLRLINPYSTTSGVTLKFYPKDAKRIASPASVSGKTLRIKFYHKGKTASRSYLTESKTRKSSTPVPAVEHKKLSTDKIYVVIDPGHGGKDPGAVNRKYKLKEKDIAFDVAKKLEKYLDQIPNLEGVLTRDKDKYMSLSARGRFCEKYREAKLFISLHLNATSRRSRMKVARGLEVYYLNPAGADSVEARNVEALENNEGEYYNPDFGEVSESSDYNDVLKVLMESTVQDNIRKSSNFGNVVNTEFKRIPYYQRYNRNKKTDVHRANFRVLRNINMPCTLVELGFISHPEEALIMNNDQFQDLMARALANSVISYLGQYNPAFRIAKYKLPSVKIDSIVKKTKKSTKYRVKSGDSLYKIAKKYSTSVKKIKRYNNMKSDRISVGKVLYIPR